MKTTLLLLVPLAAFAAQNGGFVPPACAGADAPGACRRGDACPLNAISPTSATTLSAADLVAASDEERMAEDLYRAAGARWNLPVFSHLAAAEVRHAAVFAQLAATAGVTLPAATPGVYASPDTQRLHEQLRSLVNGSQGGALKAGALLEETNISDLRRLRQRAVDEPTRAVLGQLERASMQHLGALVRNLRASGENYQPQILPADDFAAAIAGHSGAGRGRGYRGGR